MRRTAVLVFTVHSLSLGRDSWFGPDKVKHFFLGAFIQSATFGGLRATGLSKGASIAGASATTLGLSVGKELRDRNGSGTPSVRDVVWGLAGGAAISPLLLRTK